MRVVFNDRVRVVSADMALVVILRCPSWVANLTSISVKAPKSSNCEQDWLLGKSPPCLVSSPPHGTIVWLLTPAALLWCHACVAAITLQLEGVSLTSMKGMHFVHFTYIFQMCAPCQWHFSNTPSRAAHPWSHFDVTSRPLRVQYSLHIHKTVIPSCTLSSLTDLVVIYQLFVYMQTLL